MSSDDAVIGEGRGEIPMPIGRGQFRHDPPAETQRLREELERALAPVKKDIAELKELVRHESAPAPARQKNLGGHPFKFDWLGFTRAMAGKANKDSFDSYEEFRAYAVEWIAENWLKQPSEPVLRSQLGKLWDELR